eukprot:CAMPEP_0169191338 /NCGR_PEP_ID=MMETSP1016-20121227/5023_1 /TAXON_ID=342587 /ORGANISM="Karlodinium micrum, Strain CCMP2283" /LENGTH=60 /DNA_ID=CAMNT_0009267595 /DNA_START=778 /DNA_END=960 /DNA_ORIENTATION=+
MGRAQDMHADYHNGSPHTQAVYDQLQLSKDMPSRVVYIQQHLILLGTLGPPSQSSETKLS